MEHRRRERIRLAPVAVAAIVVFAACGDDGTDDASGSTADGAGAGTEPVSAETASPGSTDVTVGQGIPASSGSDATDSIPTDEASGSFPVTVDHLWGSTTVPESPERVVVLGATDVDAVLALGVTPVATAGYNFYPESGLGPWAEEHVDGDEPEFLPDAMSEVNIEEIARHDPDLIVAVTAGFEEDVYQQLSEIAPTLVRPSGTAAYTVPRDDATRMIAQALGKPDEGERLIDEANDAYAEVVAEHPEFAGKIGTVMLPYDGQYGAYLPGDTRGQFLDQLGFELPDAVSERDTGESFFVPISQEEVGLVDGDVLIVLADEPSAREFVDSDVVLQSLDVTTDGGLIIPDADQRGAITYNTVLSVPYALDQLTPLLESALE